VRGGRIIRKERRGSPLGTIVTVEDLFYNTPARRKFLKAQATEAGHCADLVARYALAHPNVRFTLLSEGRTTFRSPGNGSLFEGMVAAYGPETAKQLLEVRNQDRAEVRLSGYVGAPGTHRSNARSMTLLVNGRWVRDTLLNYAVREAYHTLLPTGRYPLVVLRLDLPPEEVDVNVHPTKAEVRFRNSGLIFEAVQRAVRRTLSEASGIPLATS
jgi:DNA mismatch repair protein MutL